ncbi:MAG: hypothetical protein AMJ43_01390 [Coxiella sp. DG_40]|nr:MAG: hypothetical protein AMJ43_01390 [Coxiella sp. DG_40]
MFLKRLLFCYIIFTVSVTTAYAGILFGDQTSNIFLGAQSFIYSHKVPMETAEKYRDGASDYVRTPIGLRVYLGYRLNKNFSLEFGYTDFGEGSSYGDIDKIFGPDHLKINAYDVTGKLIYPLTKYFDIYAALGGTIMHEDNYNLEYVWDKQPLVDYNISKFMPLIGAGISVNFIRWLSLDILAQHIFGTGQISSFTYGGLGLSLHFHI